MSYPAKFVKAVTAVLENEGGYANNPADPGGETKYGISKRSYPNLDIKNLTKDQAIDIYYRDFWVPIRADKLEDERLSMHYFDVAVNSGKGRAIRILETVTGKPLTGIIASDTITAANLLPNAAAKYVEQRKSFYNNLVLITPSMKVFLKGWLNRITHIEKKTLV